MHPDGGGLYLMVQKGGGKSWVYRYMLQGRAREMGLGPAHTISLSEARAMARDARRLKFDGIDPIEQRQLARTRSTLEAAKGFTFSRRRPHISARTRPVGATRSTPSNGRAR